MKGFDTNLRLQASSPEFSNGFLPKRQNFIKLNRRNCYPRSSFSPTMLKLFTSSASRVHHLTPVSRVVGSSPVECPLFKALSQITGWNRRSTSLGHRAFFCSEPTNGEAAAEAETKAVESDSEVSDSKSSSAIVPTNPRPEDCLTVCVTMAFCSFLCGRFVSAFVYALLDRWQSNCIGKFQFLLELLQSCKLW